MVYDVLDSSGKEGLMIEITIVIKEYDINDDKAGVSFKTTTRGMLMTNFEELVRDEIMKSMKDLNKRLGVGNDGATIEEIAKHFEESKE